MYLLTRTPGDPERRYREGDLMIQEALDYGKILYKRHVESMEVL